MNHVSSRVALVGLLIRFACLCTADEAIDVNSDGQLFVDDFLIAAQEGTRLALHRPVRREVAIDNSKPWEKYGVSYMVAFRDGDRFRAWYRCDGRPFDQPRLVTTAYAESTDGIHWEKPELGLVEFDGSKRNNIVWAMPGEKNMAVFKDGNPDCAGADRYKAIIAASSPKGKVLMALASADGLRWRRLQEKPILTDGPFDSHNVAFWDPWKKQYVVYARGVRTEGEAGDAMTKSFKGGVRWIRQATSEDFLHWTKPEPVRTGDAPIEHLYTNAAIAYERARGLYLMFPSRFADDRKPQPEWEFGKGVNDIVLLSSRDGLNFRRTFMEAFVRPGLDQGNWHERALYMERGILQTGPDELSLYGMENWRLDTVHIRRFTIRPDGFASLHAGYAGGEMLTRPITFEGKHLRLNFSTSAVGSVRVEMRKPDGEPIDGYGLTECQALYGDSLDRPVRWQSGDDVSKLQGKELRLRFVLSDADVFAFRFSD